MGKYYGVVAIETKGTSTRTFMGQAPHVSESDALIMILFNGLYDIAVDVTTEKDFTYYLGLYSAGHYTEFSLYTIPKTELENCPDIGKRYRVGD